MPVDGFLVLYASLNSLAWRVLLCPSSLASSQLNLCPVSSVCFTGSDLGSCRRMAFLCSVNGVDIFFDVSPLYRLVAVVAWEHVNGIAFVHEVRCAFVFCKH